ncbi:cupin domain-containing protein [Colletotrichum orchidophilum]|uniref:Cupin domain-containing protein n=1 Tax=Colletotrichum orchidophilum TaxID=1209926 RepID=A0A1G4ANV2_9PEZI|nr:cupin domain-containing protein [Colletotrichum orchidophilum]OHE90786.1 cupin domain-containing protein [Colletotrichum orchidophilum]
MSAPANGTNQQLSNLPPLRRLVTGHNPSTAKAVVHSATDFSWQPYDDNKMAFSVVYTTSQFPADLNGDADIAAHDNLTASNKLGLVNSNGTVIRCVDFAPGYRCGMHRTQSLDYGIVLEGEIDMVLDSGDVESMKRGDVAVQRATNHQWVNRSTTEWARMMFVLQDCKPLQVNGERLGEDLGEDLAFLPESGN